MSWWWRSRRRDGSGSTITSINISGLGVLIGVVFLLVCMGIAPPYGAVAVLTFATGGALVALSHAIAREASTNGTTCQDTCEETRPRMRRIGLVLMVGGLAACMALAVAMATDLLPQ